MSLIALTALGIIAALNMPVSLLPNIEIPEISVQVVYPNADVRQLENTVTKPLRRQLLQLNHLQDIESETRDGFALITLKFAFNTNVHYAYIETNEKIDELMGVFPREMPRPKVIKASASDIPVFYLNIVPGEAYWQQNDNLLELSNYVQNVLKRRIEQLSDVAFVDMTGLESPEILIVPDRLKLQSQNITGKEIENALNGNNIDYGNILIKDGQYQYHIGFSAGLKTLEDIRDIYMDANGHILQLKDVAEVRLRPKARQGIYLFDKKESIVMAVIKQSDAQIANMRKTLHSLVKTLQEENPQLGFEISQDQSQLLDYSIKNLKQSLLFGLVLAIAIMFFFMRNVRAPLLIGISIPVSLIISLFFLKLSGVSINIVSLSGLILGVGMMIDNSIIVIDNITQYREKLFPLNEACIIGTNEVIRPLISSVLTTCAVFVPLVFLSDISGALFFDQAVAVSISLTVSLFVSIMILPALYRLFYAKSKLKAVRNSFSKGEKLYSKGLGFIMKRKTVFILFFFLLFPLGIFLFSYIDKKYMPDVEQTEFMAEINWNEPINVGENKKRVIELLETIKTPVIINTSYIGHQQFLTGKKHEKEAREAGVYFKVGDEKKRELLEENLRAYVRAKYPAATLIIKPAENIFGQLFSEKEGPLIAKIRPDKKQNIPDPALLKENLQKLEEIIGQEQVNKIELKSSYVLTIDFEKLFLYDVQYSNLINKLKTSFSNNKIGVYKSGRDYMDILLGEDEKNISSVINNETVKNEKGVRIPLKSLLRTRQITDYKMILADKNGEYFPVKIDANFDDYTGKMIEITKAIKTGTDVEVDFSGSLFSNIKLFKELGLVLLISVLMLYFVLAAQFESLLQPIIVLFEILFDFSGALILLIIFGSSLNIMSAIGIIVMSGIIINDSILKIDTINRYRRDKVPLLEAIHLGGKRRLKPIIMTSLTTVLALLPLLFFKGLGVELQLPLALAVIGGMILGTIVSLYFIPLMYFVLYKHKQKTKI
jgi:multidrug efflux pump subunit AcrB